MVNKVTVKIYGQNYTVAGEQSVESIYKIATAVDEQMNAIGRAMYDNSTATVATLTAVNLMEELMEVREKLKNLEVENKQLKEQNSNFQNLWEKSKDTSVQNKKVMEDASSKLKEYETQLKELNQKCTEYENSFFDLQMENIQLKSQLEKGR